MRARAAKYKPQNKPEIQLAELTEPADVGGDGALEFVSRQQAATGERASVPRQSVISYRRLYTARGSGSGGG